MLRRLKREVMTQLPKKRRQVIRLPPPAADDWPKAQTSGEPSPSHRVLQLSVSSGALFHAPSLGSRGLDAVIGEGCPRGSFVSGSCMYYDQDDGNSEQGTCRLLVRQEAAYIHAGKGARGEEDEMTDGSDAEDASEQEREGPQLSPAHCTGLAKLPSVIEWLSHALGGMGQDGCASSDQQV